jgi:hypothetical protein
VTDTQAPVAPGPKRDEVIGNWRKFHNEELINVYSSPNILITKSRARWAGNLAGVGKIRSLCEPLIGKREGKRTFERPRQRWKDNIEMDLNKIVNDVGPLNFMKGLEIFD